MKKEQQMYKEFKDDEEQRMIKSSDQLLQILENHPGMFEQILRQRIVNYYLNLYGVDSEEELKKKKEKPNRIGVQGGDYVEKAFFYLVRRLVRSADLNVERELVVRGKNKNKRLDIVVYRGAKEDLNYIIGIEVKSYMDSSTLKSCKLDFENINLANNNRLKYYCVSGALHTKRGLGLKEILNDDSCKHGWIYALPKNIHKDGKRDLPKGFGCVEGMMKSILDWIKCKNYSGN